MEGIRAEKQKEERIISQTALRFTNTIEKQTSNELIGHNRTKCKLS
jgi:hypothetical protein